MESIHIEGSHGQHFIPTVDFNYETGICNLEGESYLEDSVEFYAPLYKWLKTYFNDVNKPIIFNFKLKYFNTSSSKCIIDILHILKKYENADGEVTVNWYYDASEEDIEDELEEIDDFMIESDIKINVIPES